MIHSTDLADFESSVRAVTEQSSGLLHVEVVREVDFAALRVNALMGDRMAARVGHMVTKSAKWIATAPRSKPPLCATCPRPIRPGGVYSFVVGIPACDDPTQGLAIIVCGKCATTIPEIMECAQKAFARIWPDLKPLTIHPESGNA